MKFTDVLKQCFFNLWRRKVRTILAVLGVFIGIFSILATVSIGLALSYNLDRQIQNMDGIRVIDIYPGSAGKKDANGKLIEAPKLNDKLIEELKNIKGVGSVSPLWELQGSTVVGKYSVWTQLRAVRPEMFEYYGKDLLAGQLLKASDVNSVVISERVLHEVLELYGTFDEEGKYQEPQLTDDQIKRYMGKSLEHSFDDQYKARYSYSKGVEDDFKKNVKFSITTFKITGILKGSGFSSESFISEKAAMSIYEEMIKQNPTEKEKIASYVSAYEEYKKRKEYAHLVVGVERVDDVKTIVKTLEDKGLVVNSMISWFDSIRDMFRMVQLVLGGLGAISLLVAMIGITNTTIMTIYERTKEIGIMKVIGANLKDIRNLFLFESGLIGFVGGFVGVLVALVLSFIANEIFKNADMGMSLNGDNASSMVSYIPWWLALSALVVATLIGLIAGYLPSRKAMHMSALDSLRTE